MDVWGLSQQGLWAGMGARGHGVHGLYAHLQPLVGPWRAWLLRRGAWGITGGGAAGAKGRAIRAPGVAARAATPQTQRMGLLCLSCWARGTIVCCTLLLAAALCCLCSRWCTVAIVCKCTARRDCCAPVTRWRLVAWRAKHSSCHCFRWPRHGRCAPLLAACKAEAAAALFGEPFFCAGRSARSHFVCFTC